MNEPLCNGLLKIYHVIVSYLYHQIFNIFFSFYVYRKAKAGDLNSDSGLCQLARLTEINVEEVGVVGAKSFFEAKIQEQLRTNKFHDEIRQEQEERKRAEEEKIIRRNEFQQRAAIFQQN